MIRLCLPRYLKSNSEFSVPKTACRKIRREVGMTGFSLHKSPNQSLWYFIEWWITSSRRGLWMIMLLLFRRRRIFAKIKYSICLSAPLLLARRIAFPLLCTFWRGVYQFERSMGKERMFMSRYRRLLKSWKPFFITPSFRLRKSMFLRLIICLLKINSAICAIRALLSYIHSKRISILPSNIMLL